LKWEFLIFFLFYYKQVSQAKSHELIMIIRITFIIIIVYPLIALPKVLYVDVDAGGMNNGTSWVNAFNLLTTALESAELGDEIWVAEGTYYPGATREDSFYMINSLAIYGGFNGSETDLTDRNPSDNKTILSGDIGESGSIADNCYHIIYNPQGAELDTSAILDGFVITGGNADNELSGGQGGGMNLIGGSPQIINCIFRENSAINGGGIVVSGGNPTFINVTIADNFAENGGAGMECFGANPILKDCQFINNHALNFGGGLSTDMSSPVLLRCLFVDNLSESGGALSNYTYSEPLIINCSFAYNVASSGGGIWNGLSFPIIINSIFWENTINQIYGDSSIIFYSNIEGGYEGEGNINSDPLFFDPDNRDLRLLSDSPCIDAGISFFVTEGDTIVNFDASEYDGSAPDMGLYEFEQANTVREESIELSTFSLSQNFPNPFNSGTIINYELQITNYVELSIYDVLGQKIVTLVNELKPAGSHQVEWDASGSASGIYYYRIHSGEFDDMKKMILLR
jgi:hypothetical protein